MRFEERLTHLDEYTQAHSEVAFLLGGIGTGNVSVGARGQLRDWEIWSEPGKGVTFPYTFFALHVEDDGRKYNRVLEAALQPPYSASHGIDSMDIGGLPRMRESRMRAEYPLCHVSFVDRELPVQASLDAFTPFIPLDDEDSALPVAILRYRVRNLSPRPIFAAVSGSLANMTTFNGYETFHYAHYDGPARNTAVRHEGLTGVLMESQGYPEDHPMHRSMALMTTNGECTMKPDWYNGSWYDPIQDFWDDFADDGRLCAQVPEATTGQDELMKLKGQHIASVAPCALIAPGEEQTFEFFLTWHMPYRYLGWSQKPRPGRKTTRNYYTVRFHDALDVADYVKENLPRLEHDTLAFHEALFGSTYPKAVLDALSANITVLRSPTCFRIGDGSFFGWEGCFDLEGCCDGTCTHVWNYAQTLAFLFPKLEQSMRRDDFLHETDAEGRMTFRSRKKLEEEPFNLAPAVDGQNGTIVRLYREWRLSGDDTLIRDMGESALNALDFTARYWDGDGDGLPDSRQHNTYDIEFFGPNSMACSVYLAALKAGAEIADALGQSSRADGYRRAFEAGKRRTDELLWGGAYYEQKLEDVNEHRYQFGSGCLSDQLFGQFLAHVAGLGYVLDPSHVKQAIQSVYRYNFRRDFRDFSNVQRTYALEDEQGLLLCTWPKGGRPRFPFVYCDEVWTGIEYQVAAELIYEGMTREGLELVEAVRARYDGKRRNPFDEVECGHHYARSMASWALLTALSGFSCDMRKGVMSFDPQVSPEHFSTFYSTGKSWGVYRQWLDSEGTLRRETRVLYRAEDSANA